MASIVKVAPEHRTGSATEGVAAPAVKAALKSSNGMDLMPGESEVYAAQIELKDKSQVNMSCWPKFVKKLKDALLACCCCHLYSIETKWYGDILVTDKRLVYRETQSVQEPGKKYCCYYVCCCCICPRQEDLGFEDERVFELKDIRDVQFFKGYEHKTQRCCGCCVCHDEKKEGASAVLFLTKNVGEARPNWGDWKLDKELKTYTCKLAIGEGIMGRATADGLRYVLQQVVARNANARLALLETTAASNPAQLNINLA